MQAEASLVDAALEMIARAEVSGERTARNARTSLQRWRAQSAQHESACQEAERRWSMLGQLAPALRGQFGEPAAPTRTGVVQRRALLSLAAAGLVGAAAWRWMPSGDAVQFSRNLRTGRGELLQTTLPDGSRLHLNADTDLAIALYNSRRTIRLASGEARFDVAHQQDRPFIVSTPSGTVEVVGTVFSVAERHGLLSVVVEQGIVRVRPAKLQADGPPANAAAPAIELRAGDSVSVRDGIARGIRQVDIADAAAWRSGWLVFDNTRLDEAVPAINAFAGTPLMLDGAAADLRLTGRFKANDPHSLLAALPAVLPVAVNREVGAVRISAR
ncbi:MAG: FecR domain-containing protein [Polaromonas sp.]|nr:FecR domain-containing protein [Polaromonas sp.]